MTYQLPRPSASMLLVQCALVLAFAASLYLVLATLQSKKGHETAIHQLNLQKQQMSWAAGQVDQYMEFVSTKPFYRRHATEPQWETIDEQWVELPYNKLLKRLAELYRDDRPFVLDYFSTNLESKDGDKPAGSTTSGDNASNLNKKLVFHLQGYFLCPCR